MYFLVMSQHTIHYDMNINKLSDSGASLTGFVYTTACFFDLYGFCGTIILLEAGSFSTHLTLDNCHGSSSKGSLQPA